MIEHPRQDLPRIGRELQLEELLPHLLLAAAQKSDVAHEGVATGEEEGAEPDQRIERRYSARTEAGVIAEIDEPISSVEPRRHPCMERKDALGLAVNRSDRPDAPGAHQPAIGFGVAGREG